MVNNCRHLAGSICKLSTTKQSCPCMADPEACNMYEEESPKPYQTWSAVHPDEVTKDEVAELPEYGT